VAVIVAAIVAALALGVVLLQFLPPIPGLGQANPGRGLMRGIPDEQVQEQMRSLVAELFLVLPTREDVIDTIERDPTLSDEQRRLALRMAENLPQNDIFRNANTLNNASWYVVRQPGGTEEQYRLALRFAEMAVQKAPRAGYFLNTLGVAQYRVGDYAEALKTLIESDRINSQFDEQGLRTGQPQGSIPADLAFLAMATYRLGEKDKARAFLDELRKKVARTRVNRPEAEAFLREAEDVLEGKSPAPPPKPKPKTKPKPKRNEFDA
jgi:tetratricopeptide (TPR) repeat protein